LYPTFTKKLSTTTTLTFSFNEIFNTAGLTYFIYVSGTHGQQHYFIMKEKENAWKILKAFDVPEWIRELETQLSDAIVEHQNAV
jgi:hypothetical protein